MKVDQVVIDVLQESRVEGSVLFLPDVQLERKLYTNVNKSLELLGGKWNTKAKGHIFSDDPSDILDQLISTGEVADTKKEFQYFPTPETIVMKMIAMAEIKETDSLLEPSAGQGAILRKFPFINNYAAVELNRDYCNILIAKGFKNVINADFLTLDIMADVIVMNPPFSKQQDIDHILHAWDCLNPGGRLVAISSPSPFFRDNTKSLGFRGFIQRHDAVVEDIDEGAFKESGTTIRTKLIFIQK